MALPGNIESARTTAQSAASALGELTAGGFTIGDELKKRVQDAYDYNKDLVGPLDTATLAYTGAPTEARSIFSDPGSDRYTFNPFEQEKLVSQYTQGKALPMLALGSVLGQRMGRTDDLIGAGTRAYQAETSRAQSNYDVQRQLYQDLLGEYQTSEANKQWLDLGDRKVLVDASGNIISEQPISDTSSGGGGGLGLPFVNEWEIYDGTQQPASSGAPASYPSAPSSENPIPGFGAGTTTQEPQQAAQQPAGGWNQYNTLRLIGNVLSLPGQVEEAKAGIKSKVDLGKNLASGLGALKFLF